MLPAPLPPYRVLTGLVDRLGAHRRFTVRLAVNSAAKSPGDGWCRASLPAGTDHAGAAGEEARQKATSGGTEPSAFPDTCRTTRNMAGTTVSVCLPCGYTRP